MRAIPLALVGTTMLASAALADPIWAAQNCVTPYAIHDSVGHCVGDPINSKPFEVIRNIAGTDYIFDVDEWVPVPDLAVFIYPTADCSGPAYVIYDGAPKHRAYLDWTAELWTDDLSNYTTRYQQSFQFGGPFCYQNLELVTIALAVHVKQTFIASLIAPLQ